MPVYNLAKIREMLTAAFNIGEIDTLAFDLFPKLQGDFSSGMSKSDRIKQIVREAEQHGRMPDVLAFVQKENPYQYGRFAPHFLKSEPIANPTAQSDGWQQRKAVLEGHVQVDLQLLADYENKLRFEDDPRQKLRWENEIEQQQARLAKWRHELADLVGEVEQADEKTSTEQTLLQELKQFQATITERLDIVTTQLDSIESQLTASQKAVLQRIDEQHRQTVAALVEKLDANQVELVDLLLDAHDQQQIAQWQAEQLLLLTQQALVDLHNLCQGQPEAEQWQAVLNLLQQEASWQQKLKWTVPIIPGILAFESETAVDVIPALKQTWQNLVNHLRRS
ncbi:MAG: hypothetical protein CL608_34050 [Anaerolineaceae bacterium]|nr:hypothetical protein [Anaerolineaceae bacterium]